MLNGAGGIFGATATMKDVLEGIEKAVRYS